MARYKHLPVVLALALALAASAVALSACGGGSDGSSSSSASAEEWGTTTPPGSEPIDSVTWNLPYGEPFKLDYVQSLAFSDSVVLANLCESLIHLSPEMTYEPGLAESWETPNPTTLVYDLRPGLKFSDGNPVTAEDVVFSLERNRDPATGSFWEPWFENVKSIEATGEDQVTVKLTRPDALFHQFLATAAGAVAEKSFVEAKGSKYGTSEGGVMCVGPYELADWTPGKGIRLEASRHYWNTEEAPLAKEIEFKFVTSNGTATDALTSGEIDGTFEAPLSSWTTLTSSGSGSGYLGRSLAYASIEFTEREGPVQDVRFRRALQLAIDKQAIADGIFHGTAEPIHSGFFPATWGYAQEVYERGYEAMPNVQPDPAKADALFSEVPDQRTVTLLSNADDDSAKQLAAYVQSQAKAVGIPIKLQELPAPQFVAAAFDKAQSNRYDMMLSTTGYLDLPEPVEWGEITLSSGGVFNYIGYDNPSVDRWVEEARQALDPVKRAELMVKVAQQAYGKDVVSISLVNSAERTFMGSRISGAVSSLTPIHYSPWAGNLGAVK